jgi:subtilisin
MAIGHGRRGLATVTSAPAWSSAFEHGAIKAVVALPFEDAREWAFAGSTGSGVRVAVIDSGVDGGHPRVGGIAGGVAFAPDPDDPQALVELEGPHEDLVGHGTACAAIIRSIAPDVEIFSVRVLGANLKGRGAMLLAGVEWAVDEGMDVANLSLSSKSAAMFGPLHSIADEAFFTRTLLVCAANNLPGPTYPSQYASVVSVAATPGAEETSLVYNPDPPVEFGARGIDVDVAWAEGSSITATGNSFAAPHVAGMVALMRAKHPWLTPFQAKAVLHAVCDNSTSG